MKSKVGKVKRREMFRGELKRRDLIEFIRSSGDLGVKVDQIVTHFSKQGKAISRQQVHNYLKEPWAKSLLYKEGSRYFMKHMILHDDWSIFSAYINELQYFSDFKDLWRNWHLRSDLQKNSLEDMLFQFSNKIGALISYIMIEALGPTETPKVVQDRKKIAIEFIRNAISPEYLLQTFLVTLPYNFRKKYGIGPWKIETDDQGEILIDDLGRNRKSMQRKKSIAPEINQLYINENQNPMQDLINAYNRVYPRLHDLLERGYKKYAGREYIDSVNSSRLDDV